MNWLVDDAHLAAYLRTETRPPGIRRADNIFTTGLWYVRLCQAVIGARTRGVLSEPFARLPPPERQRAMALLLELPAEVGLLGLRELAPLIGQLRVDHELNVLTGEALAAAQTLRARLLLSASSPRLEQSAAAVGLRCVVREATTR